MITPNPKNLIQEVIELATHQTDVPREQITPDSHFVADLNFDSLAQIEFVMAIEDTFNITVPDDDSEKILTIGDAVAAIEKAISALESSA